MGCKEFECFVCGKCKEELPAPEGKYTGETPPEGLLKKRIQTQGQMADATIVFVLGYLEDEPNKKQIDEYSGLNGYHIRTLPGRRWNTPVMIGAGASYLAVVDRFQDYDLIRVTDKYAGAGEAGFDTNGFPLDSVDWENLPDICSQATPAGTRVTGLKITPRGMLMAHLDSTSTYLKFDVVGRASGKVARVMEGVKTLKAPFDTLGVLTGTPSVVDANIGPKQFYTVSIIRSGDGGQAVAVVMDTLKHKVVGLQGIPASPTPISATITNNVMSVLCGDNGVASQVIRFVVDFAGGGLLAGIKSGKVTPIPQDYNVEQFPKVKDFNGRDFTPAKLATYYKIAARINESATAGDRNIPETFDPDELPTVNESSTTLNDDRVSSEAHIVSEYYSKNMTVPVQIIPVDESLGLKQLDSSYGTVTELFNRQADDGSVDREKPVFRVLHGGHYDIVAEGGYTYGSKEQAYTNGMVGESVATDKDYELGTLKVADAKAAAIDYMTGRLLYRHPKPYGNYRVYGGDYISLDPDHTNSALEAEIQAVQDDISRLQGEMEEAYANGMWTYGDSIQVEIGIHSTWKGTLNARLTALGSSGIAVKRNQATTDAESSAAAFDGVERRVVTPSISPWLYPDRDIENGDPVAAFSSKAECADDYWTMFIRRPIVPAKFDVRLLRKNWSRQYYDVEGTAHLLPEWVDHNTNPIGEDADYEMLVPPKTASMLEEYPIQFNYTGRGGFYALNLGAVSMSNKDRYNEESSSLGQFNEEYQRILDAENAKPEAERDGALIARYTQYISENTSRITQLSDLAGSTSTKDFKMIPRSTLLTLYRGLEKSDGQETPYIPEEITGIGYDDALSGVGQVITVGESDAKRACIVKTGPQAWVGITLQFQADNMDGVDRWAHPEARRNGLGIRVGEFDYESTHSGYAEAFNIIGGNIYETGYICSPWGDGAYASWGYKIKGVPAGGVSAGLLQQYANAPRGPLILTDPATIRLLAPSDAQEVLLEDLYSPEVGSMYSEIFFKRLYFLSYIPLASVVIEFWMMHHAFDVFRYGYRTIFFGDTTGGSPICAKTDPGYWAGNNCEGAACGNLTCPSVIFGGNHKLYASDPTYPHVERKIMHGMAVFTCDNPYDALGLAYGTVWKCNVYFNLNNNVRGFDIPLQP
jgi:hypothetical protein